MSVRGPVARRAERQTRFLDCRRVLAMGVAALGLAPLLLAQAPAQPPRQAPLPGAAAAAPVIRGFVTSAIGAPLIGATVIARDLDSPQTRATITTRDGSFAFTDLFDGRFVLTAAKAGYITATLGARSPATPGTPIAARRGQVIDGLTIALAGGAVISGRVFDELGQPAPGIVVSAIDRREFAGVVTVSRAATATTDDLGAYRLHSLLPGAYFVGAMPIAAPAGVPAGMLNTDGTGIQSASAPAGPGFTTAVRAAGYCAVYYPGTIDPDRAQSVVTTVDEERRGVDFRLTQIRTGRVEGSVKYEDGRSAVNAEVLAVADRRNLSLGLGEPRTRVVLVQKESVTVGGLQPGRYTVVARAAANGAMPNRDVAGATADLYAATEVTASPELIWRPTLILRRGATLGGRIVVDGISAGRDQAGRLSLSLQSLDPNASDAVAIPARIAPDGRFTFTGAPQGSYAVQAAVPGQLLRTWAVASVVLGGQDLRDVPVDVRPGADPGEIVVTVTDRVTELTGRLVDQAGRPASQYYVLVFPADQARWRARSRWLPAPMRPAIDGSYRVSGLPPGDYWLAAASAIDPAAWPSADLLRQAAVGAARLTLAAGERKVQDLQVP